MCLVKSVTVCTEVQQRNPKIRRYIIKETRL